MPIPEGQEPWWCLFCGGEIPDCRLHKPTCSDACAKALIADEVERARADGFRPKKRGRPNKPKDDHGLCTACRKPRDNPRRRWCADCRRLAAQAHRGA
jgi:hypothetical protein